MELVQKTDDLQRFVQANKQANKTIGFVPTMGALHKGHISLVRQAKEDCDICIVSIFVNPTQFNNAEDLKKYPRTLDRDAKFLEEAGVDLIFAPSVEEVYPEPDMRQFDFGHIDKVMEGEHRPGHFNGVAQVVSRLFDMVKPNKAYFGEKDFQQLAIIREMVKQLSLDVEIVSMPIVREESGLALSSRNERLTADQKKDAVKISEVLSKYSKTWNRYRVEELKGLVKTEIDLVESLSVEYFDVVDGHSLQPISEWCDTEYAVGCIAVFCGEVRLIDNVTYHKGLELFPRLS